MMPTEDLICTGCGFLAKIKWMMDRGGRLHRKKSKGGLWNETQHSKIVLDWQGRNPVFLPKKKESRNPESGNHRWFCKKPLVFGSVDPPGKDPYHSGTGCLCPPGKQNWVPQKKERSKKPTKGGKLGSMNKNPIFRWNIRKKESCQSINLVCINAQTHRQRINSETGDCMRAKQVRTDMRQWIRMVRMVMYEWTCMNGHEWMHACMHAWNGKEWNGMEITELVNESSS